MIIFTQSRFKDEIFCWSYFVCMIYYNSPLIGAPGMATFGSYLGFSYEGCTWNFSFRIVLLVTNLDFTVSASNFQHSRAAFLHAEVEVCGGGLGVLTRI